MCELIRIIDDPTRRAQAVDLDNYIHAMFPTKNKKFIKEVAYTKAFVQADGKSRLKMVVKPIHPLKLQTAPTEQEEVGANGHHTRSHQFGF